MKLRIRTTVELGILEVSQDTTLQSLCELIFSITDIPPNDMELHLRQPIEVYRLEDNPNACIADLGIEDQSVIHVRQQQMKTSGCRGLASISNARQPVNTIGPLIQPSFDRWSGLGHSSSLAPYSTSSASTVPSSLPTSSSRAKSSSTSSESSIELPPPLKSSTFTVLDIINEFTGGRSLKAENEADQKDRKRSTPLSKSLDNKNRSTVSWRQKRQQRILAQPTRRKAGKKGVSARGVLAELESIMAEVEWSEARDRRSRITDDPSKTSLEDIEHELAEQLFLTEVMPHLYGHIVVRLPALDSEKWTIPEYHG